MDESKEVLIRRLSRVIRDERVLKAFKKVLREDFVPKDLKEHAYEDRPLSIGEDATISQPTTVAIMTESLEVKEGHKVLEIGTGSGYQAAILSELSKEVYTLEINEELCRKAKKRISPTAYKMSPK